MASQKKYKDALAKRRADGPKFPGMTGRWSEMISGAIQEHEPVEPAVANLTTANLATVATPEPEPLPVATVANLTTVDILATVEPKKGFLQLPYTILDNLFPLLDPVDQTIYLKLYRLTVGFRRETCLISFETLGKSVNASKRTAVRSVERLVSLGLIEHRQVISGHKSQRGNEYRVRTPTDAKMATDAKMTTVANPTTDAKLAHMKEGSKERHESAVANAPGGPLDKFQIRTKAARLVELHHGEKAYTNARLRADVRAALVANGDEFDEDVFDEAIGTMSA